MKISYSREQLPVFFICVAIFLFPSIVRTTIVPKSFMEANYLGLISLLFLYRNAKGNTGIYIKHKLFIQSNLVLTVLLFLSFAVVTLNRRDYLTCILYVATTFLPTLIVNVDWNNTELFEKCCRVWAKGIRICCTVMFLGGTLDVFTNNSVSNFFANIYNVTSLIYNAEAGRIVPYMGHALLASELFLINYVTQYLYNTKIRNEKEKLVDVFVSLIGIAFTGSKTGIVLLLAVFIIYHTNWKNRRYIPIILLGILFLFQIGAFDTVIRRFSVSLQAGDITSNRNSALAELLANGTIQFRAFTGQNIDYGWKMVAALEYPILRWAYQFGYVVAIILSIIIFVYPLIKLFMVRADRFFITGYLAILICVNTYNGLALQRDQMLIYCMTVFFLTNMAEYMKIGSD